MKKEDLIIRKSIIASHNNGEIWGVNSDGLYDFEDVVESKFLEDMKAIRRPSTPSGIAINLNQTVVSKHLAVVFMENFVGAGASVRKVAFVGLDKDSLHNMKQVIKTYDIHFAYQFFDDFMIAKDWLL